MPASVVGLGRLTQLEVIDPRTERSHVVHLTGRWLVWDTKRRAFYVTRGRDDQRVDARLPPAVTAAHRRFHRAAPRNVYRIMVPVSPRGGARALGLIKSLVYVVPKRLVSPGKNGYRWHHALGDTGHEAHQARQGGQRYPRFHRFGDEEGLHHIDYPTKVMPALLKDRHGDLFIKRRPGNIFTVDTWLRG
jgi:hypothetical protein